MSVDQYLAFENASPIRHEYVGGEVFAMTGGSTRHSLITLNFAAYLRAAAKARGCRVFGTDVKVQVADRIYYPDVLVACGAAGEVEQVVHAPSLIVEVSSPSTRGTDRREKLDAYRQLDSLRAYLIVSQRRRQVLAYRRGADGRWERTEYSGDATIPLAMLASEIGLQEVYDGVPLPPMAVSEFGPEDEYGDWELETQ